MATLLRAVLGRRLRFGLDRGPRWLIGDLDGGARLGCYCRLHLPSARRRTSSVGRNCLGLCLCVQTSIGRRPGWLVWSCCGIHRAGVRGRRSAWFHSRCFGCGRGSIWIFLRRDGTGSPSSVLGWLRRHRRQPFRKYVRGAHRTDLVRGCLAVVNLGYDQNLFKLAQVGGGLHSDVEEKLAPGRNTGNGADRKALWENTVTAAGEDALSGRNGLVAHDFFEHDF